MAEYSPNRRATAVPSLKPITKNEAAEGSDVRLERAWEKAREAAADELRAQRDAGKRRSFASLVKPKKK